jgi:hypothetical protein
VAAHFPEHPIAPAASVLDALRERLGAERVAYAEGCKILRAPGQLSEDRSGIAAAAACARSAEVAVVVVGDRAGHFSTGTVGEGSDASDLALLAGRMVRPCSRRERHRRRARTGALRSVADRGRAAALIEARFRQMASRRSRPWPATST